MMVSSVNAAATPGLCVSRGPRGRTMSGACRRVSYAGCEIRGTASAENVGRAVEPVLRSGQPLDERDGYSFLAGEARVQAVRE